MKPFIWILAGVGISVVAYVILNETSPQYATGSDDVESAAARTSLWGTKQRASGAGDSLFGKAKEGFGRVTGNDDLAGEGVADQVAGSVKDAVGQAAGAVGTTLHDLNR